jgi:hypothetical protein
MLAVRYRFGRVEGGCGNRLNWQKWISQPVAVHAKVDSAKDVAHVPHTQDQYLHCCQEAQESKWVGTG